MARPFLIMLLLYTGGKDRGIEVRLLSDVLLPLELDLRLFQLLN